MNPLNSKYYPKIMYLALIVVSLLILFNFVNIIQDANNLEKKAITGFAIENNTNKTQLSKTEIPKQEKEEIPKEEKQELYSAKSYMMFYFLIIGIIATIFITFLSLKSTVKKDIEIEDEERRI